jgi:hypothetical protein
MGIGSGVCAHGGVDYQDTAMVEYEIAQGRFRPRRPSPCFFSRSDEVAGVHAAYGRRTGNTPSANQEASSRWGYRDRMIWSVRWAGSQSCDFAIRSDGSDHPQGHDGA